MGEVALLFLIVTLGALITGLTGLGGGSLILAGLMLLYPPELAIPLHSFTQITANAIRTTISFKSVDWKTVAAYACLMLPASWGAALIFEHINPGWLKILVGIVLIISILPFRFKPQGEPKRRTFVFLGALSGFLGVFVGSVGPMVTPFFNRLRISREGMITTKSAGQMVLQFSKIAAFSGAAQIDFLPMKGYIGTLMLASLVGVLISLPISKKIPDEKFDQAVNVLLGLIALKVLFEGISELLLNA